MLIITLTGYNQEARKVNGTIIRARFSANHPLNQFGGDKELARQDPIPNSNVKRLIADGSDCIAFARVGCRQLIF